jgi:hypothetical protein
MKLLYEILVPTMYGDTLTPIGTKHHKKWDERVQAISGGLTVLSPARGKWIFKGVEYPERVIPVRIMCTETEMDDIVMITMGHYRQKAVMYYVLSSQVTIVTKKDMSDRAAIKAAKMKGWWLVGHKNVECYWYNGKDRKPIDWNKSLINQIP